MTKGNARQRYNNKQLDSIEEVEKILGRVRMNSDESEVDNSSPLVKQSKIHDNMPPSLDDISTSNYDEEPFSTIELQTLSRDSRRSIFGGANDQLTTKEQELQNVQLSQLCGEPEVSDIIKIMTSSLIMYEDNSPHFCSINESAISRNANLDDTLQTKVIERAKELFPKYFNMLGFSKSALNEEQGGNIFKVVDEFLTYGKAAYYMLFDDMEKPTEVIDIIQLDMKKGHLVPRIHRAKNGTKYKYWIYRTFDSTRREIMMKNRMVGNRTNVIQKDITILDSQLILIDWTEVDNKYNSYIQGFERSFNLYRTMERTLLSWAINNSIYRTFYTIPVKGKGAVKAAATVNTTMMRYRNPIEFNENNGVVTIGGNKNYKMNHEVFMGETSSGTPNMETMGGDGPDMQDTQPTEYFKRKYQSQTQIPTNRFDLDNPSMWTASPESITNQESGFESYLNRIKILVSRFVLKPIWTQMRLEDEAFDTKEVRDALSLSFYSVNLFLQNAKHELLEKQLRLVADIHDMDMVEVDDVEVSRYSKSFLLEELVSVWNADDIKRNEDMIIDDLKKRQKFVEQVRKYTVDEVEEEEEE